MSEQTRNKRIPPREYLGRKARDWWYPEALAPQRKPKTVESHGRFCPGDCCAHFGVPSHRLYDRTKPPKTNRLHAEGWAEEFFEMVRRSA